MIRYHKYENWWTQLINICIVWKNDLVVHVNHRSSICWILGKGEYLAWETVINWIETPEKDVPCTLYIYDKNFIFTLIWSSTYFIIYQVPSNWLWLKFVTAKSLLRSQVSSSSGSSLVRFIRIKVRVVLYLLVWCNLHHECCTCWVHGRSRSRSWQCSWRCRPGHCHRAEGRPDSSDSLYWWDMKMSPGHSLSSCTTCQGSGSPLEVCTL